MNLTQPLIIAALFILGLALGSFTSVVIHRVHHKTGGIVRGRSRCPLCNAQLTSKDLIPLLSYLTLRGKCRYCKGDISAMYPALELTGGFLLALLYLKFPFFTDLLDWNGANFVLYALFTYYTFTLLFTFFYDLRYLKVSDEIMLPAIVVALLASFLSGTPHIIDSLIGAAIPLAFFGLQIALSRGKWMGRGDLRVGAFLGIVLGWKLTIVALVLTYLVGSIVSIGIVIRRRRFRDVKVPFAPFIISGMWITVFIGEDILAWYLGSLGL